MFIDPEFSACSIVMVGKLNPAIFHPAWLKTNGIEDDVSDAVTNVEIIHRDIAIFSIDTRSYKIEGERFSIEVTTAPWVHILDISRKIFEDLLPHTPIRAFGVNRTVHFQVKDAQTRINIGRKLAPVEPWNEYGQRMEESTSSGMPSGLQSLTMRQVKNENDALILINTRIEPSAKIMGDRGIFIEINHHHELKDYMPETGGDKAMRLLCDVFDNEIRDAETIMETIMKYGK